MTTIDDQLGEIRRTGDTAEIVFQRRYARPVEKVWAALTVPERIEDWFAPKAAIEGGAIRLEFPQVDYKIEGRIVECEPMRVFAWTWPNAAGGESVVRFELEADGDGCRLTLTQSGLTLTSGAGNGAGWHAHLAGLEQACDGVATPWSEIIARRDAVKPIYAARAPG
jgi:uncharacterized protein YndB with AHSA1/START domain